MRSSSFAQRRAAALQPSNVFAPLSSSRPSATSSSASTSAAAAAARVPEKQGRVKSELRRLLRDLTAAEGPAAAVLPGLPEQKAQIDRLLVQLEESRRMGSAGDGTESGTEGGTSGRLLEGEWELVYASNGTVVTRTPLAQAVAALGRSLPGTGLSDIRQTLNRDETGTLNAVNELLLGLGPFGSWRVGIEGKWLALDLEGESEGAQAVRPVKHRVVFDRLSLRLVGLMGLTLPSWLPPVTLPSGPGGRGAEWQTTYCDEDVRIGKGSSSGNAFLFFRSEPC